jgi:outer membrane biosynthesis protein TonB
MRRFAIALCVLAVPFFGACKREEDPPLQTTTVTTSAPTATNAGPTQLVALTQPVDSVSAEPAPALTLAPVQTQTQTPTPTSSQPSARMSLVAVGNVTANGLPAESVKGVVQKNIARYRQCYDAGLRGDPTLRGRVTMRITIDARGAIASAEDAGSDLPDGVTSCVFGTLGTLVFPQPEAGSATATVLIVFSPPP